MNLPPAPASYAQKWAAAVLDILGRAVDQCFRRGQDVEIGGGRLILTDTTSGHRYSVTTVSGTLTLVLVS